MKDFENLADTLVYKDSKGYDLEDYIKNLITKGAVHRLAKPS